jgi:hypothetical protein
MSYYPPQAHQPAPAPPNTQPAPATTIGLLLAGVVGLILSQQSVSVASGSSIVWVGFVLTLVAAVAAFIVPDMPSWAKVVLLVIAVIAFGSAIYVEHELAQRRREIQDILNQLPEITGP